MIQLRKFVLSALAVLALASCAASENSGATANTLKNNGYNAKVTSGEDYKQTSIGKELKNLDNLVDYLAASKPSSGTDDTVEGIYIWFFGNIDSASKFLEANTQLLFTLEGQIKDFTQGTRNNAAWVGSRTAGTLLGWTVI